LTARGESAPAAGRDGKIGFQQPRELQNRLVVEHHGIELRREQAGLAETELNRLRREIRIVLFAGEPFLLCGADDFSVTSSAAAAS
jgi:hypothetical protein